MTARLVCLVLLTGLAGFAQAGGAVSATDRSRVTALSKTFLRDSAELPMEVAVDAVVTDTSGKQKRHTRSTVRFLFHGYSQQAGGFHFESRTGRFSTGALRDSLPGDFAVFDALSKLAPNAKRSAEEEPTLQADAGGLLIRAVQSDCHVFELERRLYPTHYCTSVEVDAAASGAGLTLDRFSLDMRNLPAAATLADFGPVQVKRYHAEGEIQQAYLPKDPAPFFVPKRVVTTIETDKGRIVLTNVYALSAKK